MAILVVDDDRDNREIMATVLRHRGFAVLEAADAETALELAAADPPELVLMDIGLPRMNGYEAAERLHARPETALLPIIAVSAHAFWEGAPQAGGVFAAYLTKPVSPGVIADEVTRVLAATRPGAEPVPATAARTVGVFRDASPVEG